MNRFQIAMEYICVTAFWTVSRDADLSYIFNLSILTAVQRQKFSYQTLQKRSIYASIVCISG